MCKAASNVLNIYRNERPTRGGAPYLELGGRIIIKGKVYCEWARMAQPVQRLPTGWTVRGSNPGGAGFSAPVQTGPEAHPASCTMGTGSFPGVKRPRLSVDHSPHLAPRLKKE